MSATASHLGYRFLKAKAGLTTYSPD
jgi:hypothetical protein